MKISFTQSEINDLIKTILFPDQAVDIEVSIISKEDGWVENLQTSEQFPADLSENSVIETLWSDGDIMAGFASDWGWGWNTTADDHITHYRLVK